MKLARKLDNLQDYFRYSVSSQTLQALICLSLMILISTKGDIISVYNQDCLNCISHGHKYCDNKCITNATTDCIIQDQQTEITIANKIYECPLFWQRNDNNCTSHISDFNLEDDNIGMIRKNRYQVNAKQWCLLVINNYIVDKSIPGCMKIDQIQGNLEFYSNFYNEYLNGTEMATFAALNQQKLSTNLTIDQEFAIQSIDQLSQTWDQASLVKIPGNSSSRFIFVYNPDTYSNKFQLKISQAQYFCFIKRLYLALFLITGIITINS
ncbi:UNKNOWN [Stylonychia lemnae]|uniref:Uncharacterized protein n=1 Tax=Stylonychia lemnae TaxID=5949 RepID=A0A078B7Y6_STYLE|nr:UNKNOWN [Stylonychia lemnae]|eukprot:CDW89673.1 UNKNOWN [Stylonychia lemnae]